ncbi:MAG: thrombospondin type 3 repeat-containing protein [Gammaproteobacteria bacterium]|nr:thrombospondin type 3 repeat-containing protein [Gammaproteobacteria bacterium]
MTRTIGRLTLDALLALSLFTGWANQSMAYDVEPDSTGNSIYVLLLNENPGAVFHSITLGNEVPSFVAGATATIVPATVPGGGSDLAALEFDVIPGATIGASGVLTLTVSGLAVGNPVSIEVAVPLTVAASAPAAQGEVGAGVPAPDPGGLDTDGDGVPDSLELAFGSDPDAADSLPGQALAEAMPVPVLPIPAVIILAAVLTAAGFPISRHRRRSQGRSPS